MSQNAIRAAFYRGGTSKAVVFNAADLPIEREERDKIFLQIMGSPDNYGRQLDGMGGGLSSVSKVVIVEPSTIPDADIDYTFVQIAVGKPVADYGQMCGNMLSAVGPFALSEGMISTDADEITVRIHNTNTGKMFLSTFPVRNGHPEEGGSFEIPGVTQLGARVELEFLDPGGSRTGKLLPTGQARDQMHIPDVGDVHVSMIDVSNPLVIARSQDFGVIGHESPAELDANPDLMTRLDRCRRMAAVAMGLAGAADDAELSTPKIALVGPPVDFTSLDGRPYGASDYSFSVRLVSMGNVHRAIPLTAAMAFAVAARIPGHLGI